jgi:peptidoglycan/xylan/chitin deacetylase (PgdA/CDA1 family)
MTFRRIVIFLLFVLTAGLLMFRSAEKEVLSEAVLTEEVPILMYHKVSPYSAHGGPGLRVAPESFREQMKYLYKRGYNTISLNQLIDHWQRKDTLPSHPIIITFDDGYEVNYNFAFPILQRYGYTATIFLVYDNIGGLNIWDDNKNVAHNIKLLSWEQIDLMKNQGITFESHTLTHPDLAYITQEEARREITESKKKLEERLSNQVNFIAYPYGRRNPAVDEAVRASGYRGAVTTEIGKNTEYTDPVQLKRLRVTGNTTMKEFEQLLER